MAPSGFKLSNKTARCQLRRRARLPNCRRANKTHLSKTDPDALLARMFNTHPAQPSYRGHVLMDNRMP